MVVLLYYHLMLIHLPLYDILWFLVVVDAWLLDVVVQLIVSLRKIRLLIIRILALSLSLSSTLKAEGENIVRIR